MSGGLQNFEREREREASTQLIPSPNTLLPGIILLQPRPYFQSAVRSREIFRRVSLPRPREELRRKTFPPFFHFWLANKRPFKHRSPYLREQDDDSEDTSTRRTEGGAKKFSNKSLNTPGRTLFRGLCNPCPPSLLVHPRPRNNMAGSYYHLCRVKNTLSLSLSLSLSRIVPFAPRSRKARLCTTVFPFLTEQSPPTSYFIRHTFEALAASLFLPFPYPFFPSSYFLSNFPRITRWKFQDPAVTRQQPWKIRGTTIVDHSAFIPAMGAEPLLSSLLSTDFKWKSSRGNASTWTLLILFSPAGAEQGSATY